MIQKAIIVEQSPKEPHKYKVRIPVIHGLPTTPGCTRDADLPYASVCGIAGISDIFFNGDVVFVGFENGEFDTPVILGQLIVSNHVANIEDPNERQLQTHLLLQSIDVRSTDEENAYAKLPVKTQIGDVSSFEISTLQGVKKNLQVQLNDLQTQIEKLQSQLDSISD